MFWRNRSDFNPATKITLISFSVVPPYVGSVKFGFFSSASRNSMQYFSTKVRLKPFSLILSAESTDLYSLDISILKCEFRVLKISVSLSSKKSEGKILKMYLEQKLILRGLTNWANVLLPLECL